MLPLLLTLCSPALAGAPVVGVAGGVDFSTSNPWAGLELALHPTQTQGLSLIGRLAPAWAFIDGQPLLFTELGFTAVVPEDEALVRAGLVARVMGTRAEMPLPVILSEGETHTLGLVPGVMGLVEFEWGDAESPWVFTTGARAGIGSAVYDSECLDEDELPGCLLWKGSFIGGFYARARTRGGLSAEVVLGPTMHLSVGWAL